MKGKGKNGRGARLGNKEDRQKRTKGRWGKREGKRVGGGKLSVSFRRGRVKRSKIHDER